MFQLPRDCRVFAAINPAAQWGWAEMFANKTNYLLELVLWQNTPVKKGEKAAHNRRKPKPFVPDFLKTKQPESPINKGSVKRTVDDVKSILSLPRGV
jgi:hypothetical protein